MWPVSLVSSSSTVHTDTSHTASSCLVFSISLPSLSPCIRVQMLICEPSVTILLHSNQVGNDVSRYLFCSKAEQWILTPRKMFATSINYQAVEECLAMLNQCICCGCAESVNSLQWLCSIWENTRQPFVPHFFRTVQIETNIWSWKLFKHIILVTPL